MKKNTVNMVRHDNIQVDFNCRSKVGGLSPFFVDKPSQVIQLYISVYDTPKHLCKAICTDRYEIDTVLCIVIVG